MTTERFLVTGVGAISALGAGADRLWDGLRTGRCGIAKSAEYEARGYACTYAAFGPEPERPADVEPRLWAGLDKVSRYALCAASEAVASSGVDPEELASERTGVFFGVTIGGARTLEAGFRKMLNEERQRLPISTLLGIMPSASPSVVVMNYGCKGPAMVTDGACASSAQAAYVALSMLRAGVIDRAIVGGVEASITDFSWAVWQGSRVMSKTPCQPFSAERSGMTLGEAGAAFVVERESVVGRRAAEPLAELAGAGMSSSPSHFTRTDRDGPVRAIRGALASAGMTPDEVGFVNCHGTGTLTNDSVETEAIKSVFGAKSYELQLSATKSMHGHALGATAALETVATVLALRDGVATGTANYGTPDPACDLDYGTGGARPMTGPVTGKAALKNAFGFGGMNCALVLKEAA